MRAVLFIAVLVASTGLYGQQNFTLFGFDGIPYASMMRPTSPGPSNISIGLPVIGRTEVALQQNFLQMGMFNVERNFQTEFETTIGNLGKNSSLWFQTHSDLFYLGFKTRQAYISFGAYSEVSSVIAPPSDLIKMVVNGNKPFINQTLDLSYMNFAAEHYIGLHIGYMRPINEKWTIGGRVKLLNGIAGVRSDVRRFDIRLQEGEVAPYEWLINADMDVSTAGIREDVYTNYWNPQNLGFGLDFGLEYKLNEKFNFVFGVRDLGAIYWNDPAMTTYTSEVDSFRFEGIYFNADDDRPFDEQASDFADTLLDVLNFSDTSLSWTSVLSSKWNAGIEYTIDARQRIGLDYFYFSHAGSPMHAISLSYMGAYSDYFSIRAQSTFTSNDQWNLGAGFFVGRNLQFFTAVDYLHYFVFTDQLDGLSLAFGLNLNFGYGEKEKKRPKRKETELN